MLRRTGKFVRRRRVGSFFLGPYDESRRSSLQAVIRVSDPYEERLGGKRREPA